MKIKIYVNFYFNSLFRGVGTVKVKTDVVLNYSFNSLSTKQLYILRDNYMVTFEPGKGACSVMELPLFV